MKNFSKIMYDPDTTKEVAKATQEVAKATGKGLDTANQMGRFVARFISVPLEQGMGIFEDKLRYARWENQVRFQRKAESLLKELGLSMPTRPLSMKMAIPLLQAASLEDDDFLQDLWARLLINGANANSGIEIQRLHIDILERVNPLEARIIQAVYRNRPEANTDGFWTKSLPDSVEPALVLSQGDVQEAPAPDICLALTHLEQLGCLDVERYFYGGRNFSKVHTTLLGESFYDACTIKL